MKPPRTALLILLALLPTACRATPDASTENDWVELFDGESLEGWVTAGGRYDGNAAWTIEDGALTGREGAGGEGGLIYTARPYADFELEVDVRLIYPFDSGIFVRMLPRDTGLKGAQITIDHRPGGEVGAIYADGFLAHNEDAAGRMRKNEWNTFRVRCTGHPMQLEAWMNGELVADHTIEDGAGYARAGLIGLQVHGGEDPPENAMVQFKNVRVRELRTD
jgi:hypothetical protein